MSHYDDLPVPGDPDPIGSDDLDELRAEILRLRESLLAANGRSDVLRDRVEELEQSERDLDTANQELHLQLRRSPIARLGNALRRRRGPS